MKKDPSHIKGSYIYRKGVFSICHPLFSNSEVQCLSVRGQVIKQTAPHSVKDDLLLFIKTHFVWNDSALNEAGPTHDTWPSLYGRVSFLTDSSYVTILKWYQLNESSQTYWEGASLNELSISWFKAGDQILCYMYWMAYICTTNEFWHTQQIKSVQSWELWWVRATPQFCTKSFSDF